MFICKKCLEKYNNFGMITSYGKCEICGKTKECFDIPSKNLKLKD